jgi:hypothetical protein
MSGRLIIPSCSVTFKWYVWNGLVAAGAQILSVRTQLRLHGDGPSDRAPERPKASALHARQPKERECPAAILPRCRAHSESRQMFIAQALGTVIGCIVNYLTLSQVIDTKYMYLNGTKIDPSGQVSRQVESFACRGC